MSTDPKAKPGSLHPVVLVLYLLVILTLGYHSLAFGVWQFRNPKANAMTFYSHYLDVIQWRKLAEFQ